jgi:histone arginine demethylase JMJD6
MKVVDRLSANVAFDKVFEENITAARPCVLVGAAQHWTARNRWTPSYLCERYGDVLVDFVDLDGHRSSRPLRQYFDLQSDVAHSYYVCDWDFRKHHMELLTDISSIPQFDVDWVDGLSAASRPDLMWIYIGHAKTRGLTHVDSYGTSAWLAVLQGTKRVRFMRPVKGQVPSFFDLFEENSSSDIEEAELGPGDVLYVPSGAWHAAHNDSYCLSLTSNFIDGGNFMDHHLFSTRSCQSRRILIHQLNSLSQLEPGPHRERQIRHLAWALRCYRMYLDEHLGELDQFHQVLREYGA